MSNPRRLEEVDQRIEKPYFSVAYRHLCAHCAADQTAPYLNGLILRRQH